MNLPLWMTYLNPLWLACAVLMVGAAVWDGIHGRSINAAIAACYAVANVLLSMPRK